MTTVDRCRTQRDLHAMVALDNIDVLAERVTNLLSHGRRILRTLAEWPRRVDIDDCIRHGDVRLRDLIAATRLPKPHVMYAVGRLEDLGYLPDPSVR
jgi:hypothetical protein